MEDQELQKAIKKADKLEIGKALLKPIIEVMDLDPASGKLFTEGENLEKGVEVTLSTSINLYDLSSDRLAIEQDRARQRLVYQQDTAAIMLLHQEPYRCSSLLEGIRKIVDIFDKRRLVCDNILIPRILVNHLADEGCDIVDFQHTRELIMAGYLGTFLSTMIMTTNGTLTFEILDENKIVGVDSNRCKREIISELTCSRSERDKYAVNFNGIIKLYADPDAVVWVELDKKL
jgi:hypothetical protein